MQSGDIESNPGPSDPNNCSSSNALSILHLNIRSIRNKLEYIFDNFSDFDILCFTETHLDNQVTDNLLLSECSDFRIYRKDITSHSGGVSIFVRNTVHVKRRLDFEFISVKNIWLEISYKTSSFLISCIYRPPNSPVSLWDDINLSIEGALDTNKIIIILGDLNENLLNDSLSNLKNINFINNLENIITEPTRISQDSATLIDPIIISKELHTYNSGCIDIENHISDHKATFIHAKFVFSVSHV